MYFAGHWVPIEVMNEFFILWLVAVVIVGGLMLYRRGQAQEAPASALRGSPPFSARPQGALSINPCRLRACEARIVMCSIRSRVLLAGLAAVAGISLFGVAG